MPGEANIIPNVECLDEKSPIFIKALSRVPSSPHEKKRPKGRFFGGENFSALVVLKNRTRSAVFLAEKMGIEPMCPSLDNRISSHSLHS